MFFVYLCTMNVIMMHDMKRFLMATVMLAIMVLGVSAASSRYITKVATVSVTTPVGNVPRLPYRLWVTYSDGSGEYRQVRWMNASEATEKAEADATMNPVGTEYKVRGFIIGDNTTSNGYPVSAEVKVVDNGQLKMDNGQWKVVDNSQSSMFNLQSSMFNLPSTSPSSASCCSLSRVEPPSSRHGTP